MADDHHPPPSPLEALNARGLTAKREYVRGLEQRRDAEALSLLVECLCDESWFLRDLAEQAFVRMGEEHAAPLVPMLAGGLWYTRLSAARLLGRMGFRPAVPALLPLCEDPNETVALAAREAVVAVARLRGSSRIAHALVRMAPEKKRQRLAEIAERDRALAKNLERLMTDVDLMAADHPDRLVDPDEAALVEKPKPAAKAPGSKAAAAAKAVPKASAPAPAAKPEPKAAPRAAATPGPTAATVPTPKPAAPDPTAKPDSTATPRPVVTPGPAEPTPGG